MLKDIHVDEAWQACNRTQKHWQSPNCVITQILSQKPNQIESEVDFQQKEFQ
jgi:hypothetical protein